MASVFKRNTSQCSNDDSPDLGGGGSGAGHVKFERSYSEVLLSLPLRQQHSSRDMNNFGIAATGCLREYFAPGAPALRPGGRASGLNEVARATSSGAAYITILPPGGYVLCTPQKMRGLTVISEMAAEKKSERQFTAHFTSLQNPGEMGRTASMRATFTALSLAFVFGAAPGTGVGKIQHVITLM